MGLIPACMIRRANRLRIPVLMYHGVCKDGADPNTCMNLAGMMVRQRTFRQHMQYVADRFNTITMHEFVLACRGQKALPAYSCVVTFDDGLLNVYENAMPVLKELNLTAVVYVMGGSFCKQHRSWLHDLYGAIDAHSPHENAVALRTIGVMLSDGEPTYRDVWRIAREHFGDLPRDERFRQLDRLRETLGDSCDTSLELIDAQQVNELIDTGIEVGAHTLHHEPLASLSEEELEQEISENHRLMVEHVGDSFTSFCYPFGGPSTFNGEVVAKLKEHGFQSAASTIQGVNDLSTDLFEIKRLHITHDMPIESFRDAIHAVSETRRQWEERRRQIIQRWGIRSLARRVACRVGFPRR